MAFYIDHVFDILFQDSHLHHVHLFFIPAFNKYIKENVRNVG